MKHTRTAHAASVAFCYAIVIISQRVHAAIVHNLDDMNYWGSGSKRAAFVVDWADGKANETLAWGYRWDGEFHVYDMFTDLVTADPRFFARVDSDAEFGSFIFGIGYRNESAPFDVTDTVDDMGDPVSSNFVNGLWDIYTGSYWEAPLAFNGKPVNNADHYLEGWGWSFFLGEAIEENPHYEGTYYQAAPTYLYPSWWGVSTLGASDMSLIDEGWYSFSHSGEEPGSAIAAIPEPAGVFLMVFGGALFGLARRRRPRQLSVEAF